MALQLRWTPFPDFTRIRNRARSTSLRDLRRRELGRAVSSHPADYTPGLHQPSWAKSRGAPGSGRSATFKTIALSVDSGPRGKKKKKGAPQNPPKRGWIGDINETQSTSVDYPIPGRICRLKVRGERACTG